MHAIYEVPIVVNAAMATPCQAPCLTFPCDLVQDAGHVDVQMVVPAFDLHICIRVGLCEPAVEALHTHLPERLDYCLQQVMPEQPSCT